MDRFKRGSVNRPSLTKRGSILDGHKYNQAVNKMSNNFMTLVDDKAYDKLSQTITDGFTQQEIKSFLQKVQEKPAETVKQPQPVVIQK